MAAILVKSHRRGKSVIKAYISNRRASFNAFGTPRRAKLDKALHGITNDLQDKLTVTHRFLGRRGMLNHRGGPSTRTAHDIAIVGTLHARHVGPRSTQRMRKRK